MISAIFSNSICRPSIIGTCFVYLRVTIQKPTILNRMKKVILFLSCTLIIASVLNAQTEYLQDYFIGVHNPNGPVKTHKLDDKGFSSDINSANGIYSKARPLVTGKSTYKTKSGADSIVMLSYFTGEFKNGIPTGKIEEYTKEDKLKAEYYFNEKSELIKKIETPYGSKKEITEFTDKVYMKNEVYDGTTLLKKSVRTGDIIKVEEWYSDGTKKLESNLKVKANASAIDPYKEQWPSTDSHGSLKKWNNKGKLQKDYNYINDQENGKCTDYYEDGLIKSFHNYTNGVKNGKYAIYTRDKGTYGPKNAEGTPTLQEGTYLNGKRTSYKLYSGDGTFKTLAD